MSVIIRRPGRSRDWDNLTAGGSPKVHPPWEVPASVEQEPAAATLRLACVILAAEFRLLEPKRRAWMRGEACAAILTASRKAENALEKVAKVERHPQRA